MDTKFRPLRADEIECRIAQVSKTGKGVSLLLYKNARCDMNILDECIGAARWQRRHYECKGNLFCSIGIKCGSEWVWKDDCGSESYTEKEKGEASDSFKRAGFNWGIGRELYTAPFIWIPGNQCEIKEKNGRMTCTDRFHVKHITIADGKITSLCIYNDDKKMDCFTYGIPDVPQPEMDNKISASQLALLQDNLHNERVKKALVYFKKDTVEALTWDEAKEIIKKLGL